MTILLSNIVGGILLFNSASKAIENESKMGLKYLTADKASEYGKTFSLTINNVKMLSDVVKNTIDFEKCKKIGQHSDNYNKNSIPYVSEYIQNTLNKFTYDITDTTPQILGGYIIFNPMLVKNKEIIGTWASRSDTDRDLRFIDNGLVANLYPLTKSSTQWFYRPMIAGKGCWSDVYVDVDIKTNMISYTEPIYIKGEFVGIVGMDISLEQIKKYVSSITLYKTGYLTLLDNKLNFIGSKEDKSGERIGELENKKYRDLMNKTVLKDNDVFEIMQNNKKYFISYAQMPNGFILVSKVPQDEVLERLYALKFVFAGILILFLLFSIVISYKIARKIASPIEKLTEASESLAEANFNAKIPDSIQIEEIDNLSKALNKFSIIHQDHWDNENLLNIIMSNIPDGILIINECKIESCNVAMSNIFGYSKDEIVGQTLHKFLGINESDCDKVFLNPKCILSNTLINKKEVLGIKQNGDEITLEILSIELMIKSQKRLMMIIRDISVQKAIDIQKNNFISMVSHELRTPLTAIRGALGLISSGTLGEIPEKCSMLLNIANNNVIRLVSLINDILDLEKIKAGRMDFNFEELQIMPLVQEAILSINEFAKQYNVRYEIKEKLDEVLINVDKDKFIQILINLLSNAAKFSTPNEVVEIYVKRNKHLISLSVVNKGHGIPKESCPRIFESFYQVDSSDSRQKGGTGLGLNICKSIIQKMSGSIRFDSIIDDKTTFYIEFPEIYKTAIN